MRETGFLDEIVGQAPALQVLRHAWQEQRLSHAYRFSGPPGCGKTTTAVRLAREIILHDDPAGRGLLDHEAHPDLMMITIPANKTQIGVDQVAREMNSWIYMRPTRAHHKVVVIPEADRFSLPAANAMLKTLEEPPEYAVIILISEQEGMMETIISRCQNVRFLPLHDEAMTGLLQQQGVAPEKIADLVKVAQGSAGVALDLAEGEVLQEYETEAVQLCSAIASGQLPALFQVAAALEKRPLLIYFMEMGLRDFYYFAQSKSTAGLRFPEQVALYQRWEIKNSEIALEQLREINRLRGYYSGAVNKGLISINLAWCMWKLFHS